MEEDLFPHVNGQKKVKREWTGMIRENQVPHTMILYGDEGLGKTTAAVDLACRLAGGENPRPFYEICRTWIEKPGDAHDKLLQAKERIWYIRPLGMELKMEQFRLFMTASDSFTDEVHVCIIDEAQTMMPPVANALLKTLEEPAENLYFILITHDLRALLPTIQSRSVKFSFTPLDEKEYIRLMSLHADIFGVRGSEEIETAFQLTGGNPGMTREIFAGGSSGQPEKAMQFWETVTRSANPFTELSENILTDRKEFLKNLKWIRLVGRDILVSRAVPEEDFRRCRSVGTRETALAEFWTEKQMDQALQTLGTAEQACRRYISVKSIWDMIVIELRYIRKGHTAWKRL